MKRIAVFILTSALGIGVGYCATTQYNAIGSVQLSSATASGGFGLWSRTVVQLQALTPSTTGQVVYCSNCTTAGGAGTICVSTGSTNVYQWVLSTGTACK